MKVERFSFRELSGEIAVDATGKKSFVPSGKKNAGPSAPPPPPVFNEEQMKDAERNGYKKGFLEGTQEGRLQAETEQSTVDRKLLQSMEGFAQVLSPIFEDYRQMALRMSEHMPKIALAIARKIAGQALTENAQAVIEEMALHCCESMLEEPKLTITVHDSMADALTRRVEQVAAKLPAASEIVILHDADMPLADCRIEWNQGVMERRTELLWQQIEQRVENMIISALRDTNGQLETLAVSVTGKPLKHERK